MYLYIQVRDGGGIEPDIVKKEQGTAFTCFTSAKVQILTPEKLRVAGTKAQVLLTNTMV
jgi:hypothetical protein